VFLFCICGARPGPGRPPTRWTSPPARIGRRDAAQFAAPAASVRV